MRNDMHETDPTLAALVLGAVDKEKARISRELHDDIVQTLFAMKVDFAWLRQNLMRDPEGAKLKLAALQRQLEGSAASVRRIAVGLRPGVLDKEGFRGAIERLARDFQERTGAACEVQITPGLHVQEPCASTAFRIVQEALSNARKHAGAMRVLVAIKPDGVAAVSVSILDDGKGFDLAEPRRGDAMGLAGLREWASMVRGELAVSSQPGAGTLVSARLPLVTFRPLPARIQGDPHAVV